MHGLVHQYQATYDARRDQIIAVHGLIVLRVTIADVERDLESVLSRIATPCA